MALFEAEKAIRFRELRQRLSIFCGAGQNPQVLGHISMGMPIHHHEEMPF